MLMLLMVLSVSVSFAQKKVTGKVTGGDTGGGLSGATVKVKGSSTAVTTGADGSYSINVPGDNSSLEVSFVGYDATEVRVGSQSVINVVLQASSAALQTVVVTGYGSQERRSITGSVAVVDTKEMTKFAASNIADQLQGKVPGVQMSTSGDPGSSAFVRIRGIGTINNNEPLYVIDGVPVQNESNINFLNPNDIESTSPRCIRTLRSRPTVVSGRSAFTNNPRESSSSRKVFDLVEARSIDESWFMYILIVLRPFNDLRNAPGAIRSMNGSGSESELKTAA